MSYSNQAFSYVASQAGQIKDVATALGISEMAIGGAIAEEHDAFLNNLNRQMAADAIAYFSLPAHSDIAQGAKEVQANGKNANSGEEGMA